MRAILAWSFAVLLGAAVSSAWSQFPPPLPNGFQVDPAIAQVQAHHRERLILGAAMGWNKSSTALWSLREKGNSKGD
jgi:hypothetical protein